MKTLYSKLEALQAEVAVARVARLCMSMHVSPVSYMHTTSATSLNYLGCEA